jgi:hypothetical protein
VATIPATLKFTVKDCDPTTGEPDSEEGYSDDYQLEDIDLAVSDYVQRVMKVFTKIFFTQLFFFSCVCNVPYWIDSQCECINCAVDFSVCPRCRSIA